MRRRITWPGAERIGPVLAEARVAGQLSQRALAAKLGVTHSFVAKVELGSQRVALEEFFAWCEATGAEPSKLVARVLEES
ncbi:MAG: helix-turn-helix transcriptional regulator [Fimbriimonadaceae bacterium]|nr:helix-turn-helix transcriptional regulator [Fimbriimonadaceae bacterium]